MRNLNVSRNSWRLRLLLSVLATSVLAGRCTAEGYAVLAGISHYAWSAAPGHHSLDLEGPVNDVLSMRDLLLRAGFKTQNVHVLTDSQATRAGVLQSLAAVVEHAKAGDQVIFYFSGHGTSGWDKGNPTIAQEIGPDSGGLAPYDLNLTPERMYQTLIVGKRDVRPILLRLNSRATAIVLLDACYSENTAKSLGFQGTPKYIDLTEYGAKNLVRDDSDGGSIGNSEGQGVHSASPRSGDGRIAHGAQAGRLDVSKQPGAFPYPNVISLAAASRDQTASDVGRRTISAGLHTVDDRPHGAFTNSLLKGMLIVMTNGATRSVSVDRVFRYAREDMRPVFDQVPQMQQPASGDLSQNVFFGGQMEQTSGGYSAAAGGSSDAGYYGAPGAGAGAGTEAAQPPPPPPVITRIRFSGVSDALEEQILAAGNITPSVAQSDLILRYAAPAFQLFDGSGSFLRSYNREQTDALVERIALDGKVRAVTNGADWPHDFDFDLDVAEPAQQGAFYAGQRLQVAGSSTKEAYTLTMDVDVDGQIHMLTATTDASVKPSKTRILYEGLVGPPYGTDSLVAFAFLKKPEGFEHWLCKASAGGGGRCPEFRVGSDEYRRFVDFLKKQTGVTHAVLRVATYEQAPIMH